MKKMMNKRKLSVILVLMLSVVLTVFLCCCGIDTSNVAGSVSKIYNTDENIEESGDDDTDTDEETPLEEAEDTDELMVWIPKTGKCYHSKPTCSNMKNPVQIPLSQAQRTKKACSKCFD